MSVRSLLWKDARRELRSKEALQAGATLVVLFAVLYLFIFPTLEGQVRAATAVVWAPLVFAAAALSGRHIATETDTGTLDWLRAAPVHPVWIGVSRTVIDASVLLALAFATLALDALAFDLPLPAPLWLVLGLGGLGLAIIGSLTGALAAQSRARDLLLPILVVPVAAPLLLAGVQATLTVMSGGGWSDVQAPLLLLAGFDIAAAGVAWLLWPVVLEAD